MRWDEGVANRYDDWSAPMTADIPFYVGLAREADEPRVELAAMVLLPFDLDEPDFGVEELFDEGLESPYPTPGRHVA